MRVARKGKGLLNGGVLLHVDIPDRVGINVVKALDAAADPGLSRLDGKGEGELPLPVTRGCRVGVGIEQLVDDKLGVVGRKAPPSLPPFPMPAKNLVAAAAQCSGRRPVPASGSLT